MNMNSAKTATPASSSYTRELRMRWAQQMNDHYIIYMTTCPSIFHVPKSISDTNPAAYVPQRIGLGPYHHFLHDLGRKADAAQEFLKEEKFKKFKSLIVDKVKGMEALIRSPYDEYLDLDADTLGWIMAIDSVYLLHLLSKYPGKVSNDQIDDNDRDLAKDVLMLENQLPFQVLKEIRKVAMATIRDDDKVKDENSDTKKPEGEGEGKGEDDYEDDEEDKEEGEDDEDGDDNDSEGDGEQEGEKTNDEDESDEGLFNKMFAFCKAHSPLDLTEDSQLVYDAESLHLLSYMYRLIRGNWKTTEKDDEEEATFRSMDDDDEITNNVIQTARLVGDLTGQKHILFLSKLPLKQFFALFKKDKNSSSIQEINIPSASQLHYVSKVELGVCPSDDSGGSGIKYLEEEGQRKLLLPVLRLNQDSEVILRNLVAYEVQRLASLNLDKNNAVVAGYVDFMCGLTDTEKDVELLKDKGIIVSDLPNPEIVKIFNGISKSDAMRKDLEEATEKLNLVYDSSFRVKALKFITDHFVPSEALVRAFFAILIVFLLSLQAICQVYGCSSHWFRKMLSSTSTNFIGHSDA